MLEQGTLGSQWVLSNHKGWQPTLEIKATPYPSPSPLLQPPPAPPLLGTPSGHVIN